MRIAMFVLLSVSLLACSQRRGGRLVCVQVSKTPSPERVELSGCGTEPQDDEEEEQDDEETDPTAAR